MPRSQKKLGQILIEYGLINAAQLQRALDEQRRTKEFIGAILVKKGYVKEADFMKALSAQYNIPVISLKDAYLDWSIAQKLNTSLILDLKCVPVKADDWSMTFAISNPLDASALQKIEESIAPMKLKLVLASVSDIDDAVVRYTQYLRGNISKLFE